MMQGPAKRWRRSSRPGGDHDHGHAHPVPGGAGQAVPLGADDVGHDTPAPDDAAASG